MSLPYAIHGLCGRSALPLLLFVEEGELVDGEFGAEGYG